MPESFEELLKRLREDKALFLSGEEATRQAAILPILARLGWDRDNIREVYPEFPVGNGRVDYCLRHREKSVVFIEVKRTNLDLEGHQEQLLDYAFKDGVEVAVLTNGLLWWLYLALSEGSWDQRKFFTIDIQQQNVEVAAQHFRDFLNRDAIVDGSAVKRAKEMHAGRAKDRRIRDAIPKAWNQLCQEPDEQLLELLAKKVESICGHRPDQELLAEQIAATIRNPAKPPPDSREPIKPKLPVQPLLPNEDSSDGGVYTYQRPTAYTFKGQRYAVSTFQDILMGICDSLYQAHSGDFARVLTLRGRRRVYFSRDFKGMIVPKEIPGSGIYAETNLSAQGVIKRCGELLALFGYSSDALRVEKQPR